MQLRRKFSFKKYIGVLFFISIFFLICSIFYTTFLEAPATFKPHTMFLVREGDSGGEVAMRLKNDGLIQSRTAFKIFIRFYSEKRGLVAGDYNFEKPEGVASLARRFSKGEYGIENIRITIPEGLNLSQISKTLDEKLFRFNPDVFMGIASTSEGYLFPDTYFVPPNSSEEAIFKLFRKRFDEKIVEVNTDIRRFRRSLEDVIIMASLLEEEARTEETRRTIAGILWKRLDEKMPLQVDATFIYVNGKNTFQLTTDDLRTDHPYNTYTRRGLPPTAISNPGLDAIRDAITPIDSPYYFYLSDIDGEMHYAVTHDDHVANKRTYLR